jgi:pSer/pThr/pTyr-binding forkhead associated (FHA) protein
MPDVDLFTLSLWVMRLAFVALLYIFFMLLARALWRDLRSTVMETGRALGRLIVVASPGGIPPEGLSVPLDAVTSLGRDVNNSIVVEDDFASAEHAVLTFRGRAWYVEDRRSTNGTYLNGQRVDAVAPMGFGDELQVGRVRFRLERVAPGA